MCTGSQAAILPCAPSPLLAHRACTRPSAADRLPSRAHNPLLSRLSQLASCATATIGAAQAVARPSRKMIQARATSRPPPRTQGRPRPRQLALHRLSVPGSRSGPRAVFAYPPCPGRYPQRRPSSRRCIWRLSTSSRRCSGCLAAIPTLSSSTHAPPTLTTSTSPYTSFCTLLPTHCPPRPIRRRRTHPRSFGRRCATNGTAAGPTAAVGGATIGTLGRPPRPPNARSAEPACGRGGLAAGALAATWEGRVRPRLPRAAGFGWSG